MEKMEYGEVQYHHLRVLQLHESVTVRLVRHLFDPERRIDNRRLGILLELHLSPDRGTLTSEKLNILDASTKLWHCNLHRRSCRAGVSIFQEVYR